MQRFNASRLLSRVAAVSCRNGGKAVGGRTSQTLLLKSSLPLPQSTLFRAMSTQMQPSADKKTAVPTGFCMQCEQTKDATGCGSDGLPGVCGKTPEVSALQDLFIYQMQGISQYAHRARQVAGLSDPEIDHFVLAGSFSTLTNVNFDPTAFESYLKKGVDMRNKAKALYEKACKSKGVTPEKLTGPADLDLTMVKGDRALLEHMGKSVGVKARQAHIGNDDIHGLAELSLYGLKGLMAYSHHAMDLGQESEEIYATVHESMDLLTRSKGQDLGTMLGLALNVGKANLKAMEILDKGHRDRFGIPEPTQVRCSGVAGKAILISGHDLADLEEVLKRTEGTGINVYTHGEMMPAHSYPKLKKYSHLKGNYGGPWQLQKFEFSRFPGPIIMTSNCIVEPQKRYKGRIFTRRFVGWEGVPNITDWDKDFPAVIKKAMDEPGFKVDEPEAASTTVGFGRDTVLGIADKVIDAVKTGDVKRFFVIGGCDGSEGERSYFKDLATGLPRDAVILTMGCGKYRFNKIPFETTKGGLPRMLDMGQCNDSYSGIVIASALADAFKTDVNSLPLSFAVSWFEQKAVAVLLTLLHLGIKGIYLGPNLPAFVTPNMLKILIEKYNIRGTNPDWKADLKQMMEGK